MTRNRTYYLLSLGEAVYKGAVVPHGKCIASMDLTISDEDAATLDDVLACASLSLSKTREWPEEENIMSDTKRTPKQEDIGLKYKIGQPGDWDIGTVTAVTDTHWIVTWSDGEVTEEYEMDEAQYRHQ